MVHEAGLDLVKYKSANQALEELKNKRLVDGFPINRMKEDYWGRPFQWLVKTQGADAVIRVGFKGRDGVSQEGEGDDLYMDFFIKVDGTSYYYLKPCPKK